MDPSAIQNKKARVTRLNNVRDRAVFNFNMFIPTLIFIYSKQALHGKVLLRNIPFNR